MFSIKISFVIHGRQAFFLHFLASSMDDEHSFLILLSSPVGDELSFLFCYLPSRRTGVLFSFSVNPIALETQFFLFFLHGAHIELT